MMGIPKKPHIIVPLERKRAGSWALHMAPHARSAQPTKERDPRRMLWLAEGISDRNPIPLGVTGTEQIVVMDQVHARFRTNKDGMCDVKPEAAAKVAHELVLADIIRAGKNIKEGLVEADALRPDSSQQFGSEVRTNRGRPNSIESPKKRAKRLAASIRILAGPPEDLAFNSKVMPDQNVPAETWKDSPAYILRKVVAGSAGTGCGTDSTQTKSEVELLCADRQRQADEECSEEQSSHKILPKLRLDVLWPPTVAESLDAGFP